MQGSARLVLLLASFAAASCLATRNFTEPDRPRYDGGYGSPGATPAADAPVRIVTFNIEHAREVDRAIVLLRSTPELQAPDLLLLQEMDAAGVERIGRELALNYVYFPSAVHPQSHRLFGEAVLSPWPLTGARKIVLPHAAFGTGVRRSVTTAVMERGSLRIRAYSVHLPAPAAVDRDQRQEQVRILAADAARADLPVSNTR